jgi:hypothetical protein
MLNLPAIRFRKLNTILNALKMQIEDGGDDPVVNDYLVKRVYPMVDHEFSNWCYDLMFELHNAGLSESAYHERRIEYIQEFLELFPGEKNDADILLNFGRGKAEALWRLGRIPESEAVYANLVERLQDAGWAYIGWADEYWIFQDSSKDYARGEAILRQALQHPNLQDRSDVVKQVFGRHRLLMAFCSSVSEWGNEFYFNGPGVRDETKKAFSGRIHIHIYSL